MAISHTTYLFMIIIPLFVWNEIFIIYSMKDWLIKQTKNQIEIIYINLRFDSEKALSWSLHISFVFDNNLLGTTFPKPPSYYNFN